MSALDDLEDAREEYLRLKAFDRISRRLVFGGLGLITAAAISSMTLPFPGTANLALVAFLFIILGVALFCYTQFDDRISDAKADVRRAERRLAQEAGL